MVFWIWGFWEGVPCETAANQWQPRPITLRPFWAVWHVACVLRTQTHRKKGQKERENRKNAFSNRFELSFGPTAEEIMR